jgi:hypothetical protein
MRLGCRGAIHDGRITSLEADAKARDYNYNELSRQITGIQTTLSNQIGVFSGFIQKLEKYTEQTTEVRTEVRGLHGYIDDVAKDARAHAGNGSLHHG